MTCSIQRRAHPSWYDADAFFRKAACSQDAGTASLRIGFRAGRHSCRPTDACRAVLCLNARHVAAFRCVDQVVILSWRLVTVRV